MKKRKFDKSTIEKILKNDVSLKITSLVLAIILFVTINQVGNPIWKDIFKTTEYIDSVPIQVKYDSEKYVVSGIPNAVPVTISGSENNVASEMRKIDAIYGELSLNNRGPGEYEISSGDIDFNTQPYITTEPTIQKFNVKIQQKVKKEMPISISYINGQGAASGYILKNPILSQTNTVITGGNEDVESIVSVMGFVDLSSLEVTENTEPKEFDVVLVAYNAKGDVVQNVSLDPTTIKVTQAYELNTIELPVTYTYTNNDTGKFVSSVCDITSTTNCTDQVVSTVKVYGDSNKIKDIDAIEYKIDLKGFKGTKGEVTATPVLESGVYVLGEYDKKYNIELEEGIEREITNVPFQVTNLNPSLQAKTIPGESPTISVSVTGAKSVVEKMTEKDIVLSLDMSEVSKPGKHTIQIRVKKMQDYKFKLSKDRMEIEVGEI